MNRVILIGRLTKDPDVRQTDSGKLVVKFTLAINRTYKEPNGEYGVDFINNVCFGQSADFLAAYCHKGDLISVVGKIQVHQYKDKDNNQRTETSIMCDSVEMLNSVNKN